MDIPALGNLISSHITSSKGWVFSQEWHPPQHSARTVMNSAAQRCRALSHVFRERGKDKKETTDLPVRNDRVEGSVDSGKRLCGQEIFPNPSTCSGSGSAQPQHQYWSTTFPVIQRKWPSLSQALLPAAPWKSLIQPQTNPQQIPVAWEKLSPRC